MLIDDRPSLRPDHEEPRRELRDTFQEGDAAMGLLSGTRGTQKLSSILFALLALIALLAMWAPVSTGPIGAAPAWASGSPDETLNPQPTPKSTQAPQTTYDASSATLTTTSTTTLSWKDYLLLVWKNLAVSRF